MTNKDFLQRFIASVSAQGGSITRNEALEHMEGNPINVLHETPEQFAKGWIDGCDDGSDALLTHPARYGAS